MKRTQKPKWDDPAESERFLEAAKAAEASGDLGDFQRALKRIVKPR